MRIRNVWIVLTTWGLAAAALAQTQSPPATGTGAAQPAPQASGPTTGPSTASSPHQRNVTRLAEAGPGGSISSGMKVDDRSGQSLGTVAKVLRDKSGRRRYVVVTGSDGSTTPVPYDVATATIAGGRVVLDRAAFEQAPKVKESQLSKRPSRWRTKVNQYWSKPAG